jgi:hypothetical protein
MIPLRQDTDISRRAIKCLLLVCVRAVVVIGLEFLLGDKEECHTHAYSAKLSMVYVNNRMSLPA